MVRNITEPHLYIEELKKRPIIIPKTQSLFFNIKINWQIKDKTNLYKIVLGLSNLRVKLRTFVA